MQDPSQVFIKIKPDSPQETFPIDSQFQVLNSNSVSLDNKFFKFDYIGKNTISPDDFFLATFQSVCQDFLSGSSIAVLSYGQSHSGKTYTLYGDGKDLGIVQRSCEYILKNIGNSVLKCSMIEVLQDNIFDLLAPSVKGLSLKEDSRTRVSVDGTCEENLKSLADLGELLKRTWKKLGGGKSHVVFTLTVNGNPNKLQFVDLAGTERSKKNEGKANGVNKSLSVLSNVVKALSQKSEYARFRDSKLTYFLKDSFFNSKIVLLATISPLQKNFWDTMNTLKFAQRCKNINNTVCNLENQATIEYLQKEINSLQQNLDFYKGIEAEFEIFKDCHEKCEKKFKDFAKKVRVLEEENTILRKEICELNKIENSDWLLSSDSEENEAIQALTKENTALLANLKIVQSELTEKSKQLQFSNVEIEDLSQKLLKSSLDLEEKSDFLLEYEKKCQTYQELSVLLSKQNSELISELAKSKEICYEYIADFSSMSSADSSKSEIYKIIEEKDAKANVLLENMKVAEETLQKLSEKYVNDIGILKKQLAKAKAELGKSKSENIREYKEAMSVLEELKQEKNRLLAVLAELEAGSEKKKTAELKEINGMLLESLNKKAEQIAELQKQFAKFINDKGCSLDLVQKLSNKTQKLKNFANEFSKIQSFLLKNPQYRNKLEKMTISDCVIEILTNFQKRGKISPIDLEKLNFSHS